MFIPDKNHIFQGFFPYSSMQLQGFIFCISQDRLTAIKNNSKISVGLKEYFFLLITIQYRSSGTLLHEAIQGCRFLLCQVHSFQPPNRGSGGRIGRVNQGNLRSRHGSMNLTFIHTPQSGISSMTTVNSKEDQEYCSRNQKVTMGNNDPNSFSHIPFHVTIRVRSFHFLK